VGLTAFEQALRLLSIVLAAAVIWRIVQQRIFAMPLSSLAAMLGVVLARDAIVSIPRYDSHAYTVAWEVTLPVLLGAQMWAGFDTLRATARIYSTFGTFAVRLYTACLLLSTALCGLSFPFELRRLSGAEALLRELFLLQRCTDSCIAGTLILAAVFPAVHRAPSQQPPRNLVLHTILLSLYFSGYAALFLAENLTVLGGAAMFERVQFVLVILVYAAWAIGLSKEGARSAPWPEIDVFVLRTIDAPAQEDL
jgi:hypothetical protein